MNTLVLDLFMYLLFAAVDGFRDAVTYHNAAHPKKIDFNEHVIYFLSRVLVAYFIVGNNLVMLISFGLCFSFIHNGVYFSARNYLHLRYYLRMKKANLYPPIPYKNWFFDASKTTDAKVSFTFWVRLIMFIVGYSIFFYSVCRSH